MTGYTVVQVSRLRRRFAEEGLAGLHDKPRSGRPPVITGRTRARVVAKTLKPPGAGLTHWSTRDLAAAVGVSHTTVHRIWRRTTSNRIGSRRSSSALIPTPRTRSTTSSVST